MCQVDILMANVVVISRFEEHYTDAHKFIPERLICGGEPGTKGAPVRHFAARTPDTALESALWYAIRQSGAGADARKGEIFS